MQSRIAKRTTLQRLVISGCALAVLSSVGCKTGMSVPGASMLGFKKQPSAETLAGQGPTTTFPVSPSNTFTPNAIASKTAGTGTTNSTVPQGAAAANGFATTTNTTAPSNPYAPPSSAPSYALAGWGNSSTAGQPTATPGYAPSGTAYQTPSQASVPSYTPPSAYNPSGAALASGATTPNPYSQPNTYTPPTNTYAQPNTGNFASSPYGTSAPSSNPYAAPAGQPGYTAPNTGAYDPQTARVAGGFTLPQGSATTAGGTMNSMGTAAPTTFRPGSTAGATSYPSTPYTTPGSTMVR